MGIFKRLLGKTGTALKQYFGAFTVNEFIAGRTFRWKANSSKTTEVIDPDNVKSAAMTLESCLVMSENIPDNESVMVSLTRRELVAFTHYMRQLDTEYRYLHAMVLKHGTKDVQEAAKSGAGYGGLEEVPGGSSPNEDNQFGARVVSRARRKSSP